MFPVVSIVLFSQFTMGELHDASVYIEDVIDVIFVLGVIASNLVEIIRITDGHVAQ